MFETQNCSKCGKSYPVMKIFVHPLDSMKRVCECCAIQLEKIRIKKIFRDEIGVHKNPFST